MLVIHFLNVELNKDILSEFEEIKKYIPQREPMIMVSELISATEKEALTKLFISSDNIFCNNGLFDESGIIENIAQTAAAMTGYNTISNNQEVKKGFIGSINKLKIYNLPKCKREIKTKVIVENIVMNVHIIKGTVWQDGNMIAECEMKIFLEN